MYNIYSKSKAARNFVTSLRLHLRARIVSIVIYQLLFGILLSCNVEQGLSVQKKILKKIDDSKVCKQKHIEFNLREQFIDFIQNSNVSIQEFEGYFENKNTIIYQIWKAYKRKNNISSEQSIIYESNKVAHVATSDEDFSKEQVCSVIRILRESTCNVEGEEKQNSELNEKQNNEAEKYTEIQQLYEAPSPQSINDSRFTVELQKYIIEFIESLLKEHVVNLFLDCINIPKFNKKFLMNYIFLDGLKYIQGKLGASFLLFLLENKQVGLVLLLINNEIDISYQNEHHRGILYYAMVLNEKKLIYKVLEIISNSDSGVKDKFKNRVYKSYTTKKTYLLTLMQFIAFSMQDPKIMENLIFFFKLENEINKVPQDSKFRKSTPFELACTQSADIVDLFVHRFNSKDTHILNNIPRGLSNAIFSFQSDVVCILIKSQYDQYSKCDKLNNSIIKFTESCISNNRIGEFNKLTILKKLKSYLSNNVKKNERFVDTFWILTIFGKVFIFAMFTFLCIIFLCAICNRHTR